MQIPSNQIAARVGAPRVLSACLTVWGLLSAATSLVRTERGLLVLCRVNTLAEFLLRTSCDDVLEKCLAGGRVR